MSRILKCLFGKKKGKYEKQRKCSKNLHELSETEAEAIYNEYLKAKSHKQDQGACDTSESPYRSKSRKVRSYRVIKSYPASPKRVSRCDKGYYSDEKTYDPCKQDSTVVFIAGVPNNSSIIGSKVEDDKRKFPFEICNPAPRRSAMLYSVKYDDDLRLSYSVENLMDDMDLPSTSDGRHSSFLNKQSNNQEYAAKHVKIVTESEDGKNNNNENINKEVISQPVKRTVVRFRPGSTASCPPPSESVKDMPLRSDEVPPLFQGPGKYVQPMSLKSSRHSTVLKTSDGKTLQPVEKDKLRTSMRIDKLAKRTSFMETAVDGEVLVSQEPVVYAVPRVSVIKKPERISKKMSVMEPIMYNRAPDLTTQEPVTCGTRQSSLVRRSVRVSKKNSTFQPVTTDEGFTTPTQEPVMYTSHGPRISVTRRPSLRYSLQHQAEPVQIRKSSILRESVNQARRKSFIFKQEDNQPVVYAVPVVPARRRNNTSVYRQPSRGRTSSILQQSVKSLASKNQEPQHIVSKKNIRYSMDTDVFSSGVCQKSVPKSTPGYVNMEKGGQPMLVSEFLNPITTLFVSDLKDSVPKDPLTKPKETNNWVQPRRASTQRSYVRPLQSSPRVIAVQQPTPKTTPYFPAKKRQNVSYNPRDELDSSSSDESVEVYQKRPKKPYYQHSVYAAQVPVTNLPGVEHQPDLEKEDKGKSPSFKKHGKHSEPDIVVKDLCGLQCESHKKPCDPSSPAHSDSEKRTNIEDDDQLDLICYPSERHFKSPSRSAESGSKLRWRIIIKRGDDK